MASNRPRAGTFVAQPSGYRAFLPAPLPPDPPIELEGELLSLLSDADIALGRLDGVVKVIPDPEFFVAMYVRREAVLSSQIEGTQSTLEDLLEVELEPDAQDRGDVGEIVNYVAAMNHGLARLHELPLSLRLIACLREAPFGSNPVLGPAEIRRVSRARLAGEIHAELLPSRVQARAAVIEARQAPTRRACRSMICV